MMTDTNDQPTRTRIRRQWTTPPYLLNQDGTTDVVQTNLRASREDLDELSAVAARLGKARNELVVEILRAFLARNRR